MIDICNNPWAFAAITSLAYPAGALVGHILDLAIKTVRQPRRTQNATRRFHIRRA